MAYLGSEAYRLDSSEQTYERQAPRPSFDVVEGGGADARARQGLTEPVFARVKAILIMTAAFGLFGIVCVNMSVMAVCAKSANATLERQISDAEELNSALRIERSILSSSARIERIAVQSYGMVPVSNHDVLVLPVAPTAETDADAETDVSTQANAGVDPQAAAELAA